MDGNGASKKRILVVDDDETVLESVRSILESQGYAVSTADDGQAVVERIKDEKPILVILDVMLPGCDGLTISNAIKKDPQVGRTKVLLLSGRAKRIEDNNSIQIRSDGFLSKPFEYQELLAAVGSLVNS